MTDPFPPFTPDPSEWRWKFTKEAIALLEARRATMRIHSFDYEEPRTGVVLFESWAGRTKAPVEVLGQTLKMYRVRYLTSALGHRVGQRALVPKYAVVFDDATASARQGEPHVSRVSLLNPP